MGELSVESYDAEFLNLAELNADSEFKRIRLSIEQVGKAFHGCGSGNTAAYLVIIQKLFENIRSGVIFVELNNQHGMKKFTITSDYVLEDSKDITSLFIGS